MVFLKTGLSPPGPEELMAGLTGDPRGPALACPVRFSFCIDRAPGFGSKFAG